MLNSYNDIQNVRLYFDEPIHLPNVTVQGGMSKRKICVSYFLKTGAGHQRLVDSERYIIKTVQHVVTNRWGRPPNTGFL